MKIKEINILIQALTFDKYSVGHMCNWVTTGILTSGNGIIETFFLTHDYEIYSLRHSLGQVNYTKILQKCTFLFSFYGLSWHPV